jgi:hypothetical protein
MGPHRLRITKKLDVSPCPSAPMWVRNTFPDPLHKKEIATNQALTFRPRVQCVGFRVQGSGFRDAGGNMSVHTRARGWQHERAYARTRVRGYARSCCHPHP